MSLFTLTATALLSTASAGPADLETTLTLPAGPLVYTEDTVTVEVANVGGKNANDVELVVYLPETHTSPTVHVMGILGAIDADCAQVGNTLECDLGRIRKNNSVTVWFDIALPQSSASVDFTASASTTSSESNTGNNDDTDSASQSFVSVSITDGDDAWIDHCTGQGLTAFYECSLYPSSITSHDHRFEAGGIISFPSGPAGFAGTWSQPTSDSLTFTYTDNGTPVATFNGDGVDADCFEGLTTFPNSVWVSPYSVCLQ